MNKTSRREYLGTLITATFAGLTGCTGSEATSSDKGESGCSSTLVEANDTTSLLRTSVLRDGEHVLLEASLEKEAANAEGIRAINVFDAAGRLKYEIPRPDQPDRPDGDEFESYYQTLGVAPSHGHLRVEAVSDDGAVVDFREYTFSCNTDPFD